MYYYEVAPNIIVRSGTESFTYSHESILSVGTIVQVEIGKKVVNGIIMQKTNKPEYATKPIVKIIEKNPLPNPLVDTAKWMSSYYATPLATVLQTVLPRGVATKRRSKSHSLNSLFNRQRTNFVLTKDQSQAVAKIETMQPGTTLLHGITGSGKTTVYIELAKKAIAEGKSVILLVPEIALTSQLVAEFSQHFKDILLAHSRQTEAERHLVWLEALNSPTPRVVIGPRSALFIPVSKIGFIIIDECHEPSFKQEQSPRYSALRAASTLAHFSDAKLVLGSATPLVADYFLAQQTNRPIIEMPSPARQATPPSVSLVDMTKRSEFKKHRFLSDKLITQLEQTLVSGHQSLIFHNRRGTASTTLCENCGWNAGCPRCFVPLTLHNDQHQLQCHICGFSDRVPTSCPECGHADIIHKGIGTKRIEEEIRKLFPKATILRTDGDSDKTQTVEARYNDIYQGNVDILIGTQVLAKGLDLPKLRTVGVIQADAGMSLPDYSASERTFQLLSQVIGRVGRSHHPTDVIVQSYQPNHPTIQDGIARHYQPFYERTLQARKHANFPPFCFLLKLTCVYKTEKAAIKNAKELAAKLKDSNLDIEILGPTPAFYERVRDTYRWQLVIKSSKRQLLIDTLQLVPNKNWQFELDPTSLL
ncbi:MAG TPA: primosomal protein N' [Candidatus Saccharimonadales bacterium]